MREKPYTAAELFDLIVAELKDKNLYPEILDYHLATSRYEVIDTNEFSFRNNLDYGGSEGIYLDISAGFYDESEGKRNIHLGTFKTLETNIKAMETMGKLLADFIVIGTKFVNSHIDDFKFDGIKITGIKDDGSTLGFSCIAHSNEEKKKKTKEIFEKCPDVQKVVIKDRKTRREIEISRCED